MYSKEPTVQQQPGPGRSRTCFLHKPACCMSQWQQAKTVATESQFRGNYRYFWITLEQTEKTNQKTTKTTRKKGNKNKKNSKNNKTESNKNSKKKNNNKNSKNNKKEGQQEQQE